MEGITIPPKTTAPEAADLEIEFAEPNTVASPEIPDLSAATTSADLRIDGTDNY